MIKLPSILQNLTTTIINAKINQIFIIVKLLMEAVKYTPKLVTWDVWSQ